MPFPPNYLKLEEAGYRSIRMEVCPDCHESIEIYTTPAGRELAFNPMHMLTDKCLPHWDTCKPRFKGKDGQDTLAINGYYKSGESVCFQCKEMVHLYTGPDGTQVAVNPNASGSWEEVLHNCKVVQYRTNPPVALRQEDSSEASSEHQQELEDALAPQQVDVSAIKMYAVNDPNHQLIAVGYEPVDGILRCRFRKATYDYRGVPEDKFESIKRVPWAYSYFCKTVKGKFPCVKVT